MHVWLCNQCNYFLYIVLWGTYKHLLMTTWSFMTIPPWFPRRLIVYWQLIIRLYFWNFHCNTFLSLYKPYIRPVLEYGNIIWGPQYVLDQRQIKDIQKRATKLAHDLQNCTYNDRLAACTYNLPSLKYPRERGEMTMSYQPLHSGLIRIVFFTNNLLGVTITSY